MEEKRKTFDAQPKTVDNGGTMDELIAALKEQTQAINALVESNSQLMMALADIMLDGEEEQVQTHYLDGTPK